MCRIFNKEWTKLTDRTPYPGKGVIVKENGDRYRFEAIYAYKANIGWCWIGTAGCYKDKQMKCAKEDEWKYIK